MLATFLRIARRFLFALTLLAFLGVVAAAIALRYTDRVWWATLFGFGPRWVMVVPLGGLLPAILIVAAWRAFALWMVAASVAIWGVLGVVTPVGHLILLDAPDDIPLAVATANVEGHVEHVVELLDTAHLDVLALQEWRNSTQLAGMFPRLFTQQRDGLGIVSRYPIKLVQFLDFTELALGSDGALARFDLKLPAGGDVTKTLHVYVVHLETPREGIQEWLDHKRDVGFFTAPALDWNSRVRRIESATARTYIDEVGGQFIVLGDFNMPVESSIYRHWWSDLQNAYSTAGWGLGHTKHTRKIGVRIDHVLTGAGFDVASAEPGPPIGSDHVPMIARLRVHYADVK